MGCISCKQSSSNKINVSSGISNTQYGCNTHAMDIVTPLENIQNGDKNFCFTEITDKICESLAHDKGIHPTSTNKNNDCDDLTALNDLATGSLHNALMTLNMCDVDAYKCWLDSLLSWQWNVDKALICAICGLWSVAHCLDDKTKNSVRVVKLWNGSQSIFDLPTIPLSESLDNFDYLDLHFRFGTEHVVGRVSLASGLSGIPTIVLTDKVAANTKYKVGAGAIANKEVGIKYPNAKNVKIDHFIWSITGMANTGSTDKVNPAIFLPFSSTISTKAYNDSQDIEDDRTHTVIKVEGIISRSTDSCIGG